MTTTTLERPAARSAAASRPAPAPIPFSRIVGVELRKMFNTRSGFWLVASIAIAAVLATGAVILFAPDSELTYETFSAAIGFPMAVILPMVAILSVTSEWSQRSGLTTFALVPHRGRVVGGKLVATVLIAVTAMLVALAVGALGNVVGTAITGTETVWNSSVSEFLLIVLANVLGMLIGFTLGVVIRSSPGAIVAYFIYAMLLPTVFGMLAAYQGWFRDLQPWVDFNYSSMGLYESTWSNAEWAQVGTSGLIWLVAPLAVGLWSLLRSEVK